jgi:thymidylate kinase
MRHKLIVVEGIDNVGKTSSARLLAERLSVQGFPALYYKTPPEQFAEATQLVNELASRDAHFLYHAAMVKYAEGQIAQLMMNQTVVCDRWFYSTYAYHAAAGSRLQLHWEDLVEIRPDHAFLLLVESEEERLKRAMRKGSAAEKHDLKTKTEAPLLERADRTLKSAGLEHIDTTNLSLEEVVDIMFHKVMSS